MLLLPDPSPPKQVPAEPHHLPPEQCVLHGEQGGEAELAGTLPGTLQGNQRLAALPPPCCPALAG